MKLNNPQKFINDSTIDSNLIAVGEIKCQFSEYESPTAESDWVEIYDEETFYKWIRISFDNGNNYPIKYKLNLVDPATEINGSFIINNTVFSENKDDLGVIDEEYPYKYVIALTETEYIKNVGKGLNISLFNEDESNTIKTYVNIFAPIKYKEITTATSTKEYFIEILVTETFITNYSGYTCTFRS